ERARGGDVAARGGLAPAPRPRELVDAGAQLGRQRRRGRIGREALGLEAREQIVRRALRRAAVGERSRVGAQRGGERAGRLSRGLFAGARELVLDAAARGADLSGLLAPAARA